MPALENVILIAAPPARVFDCARDVGLHVRSLRHTGECVVAGRTEGLLELDDRITWRARHFGIPWRMTMRISGFERPRWFRDQMVRGPFRSFMHDHYFEESERGTRMHDVLTYHGPLGLLGRIAERVLVHDHMAELFAHRAEAIREAAETAHAVCPTS